MYFKIFLDYFEKKLSKIFPFHLSLKLSNKVKKVYDFSFSSLYSKGRKYLWIVKNLCHTYAIPRTLLSINNKTFKKL